MSSQSDRSREEQKEEFADSDEEKINFKLNEHVDCQDEVNKWLNAEILAISNHQIRLHFTGWSSKFDMWIDKASPRIQKQWKKGMKFSLNNRLDAKDECDKWLEAIIINISENQIKLHFIGYSAKFDIWFDKNSDRISEVGSYSKAHGAAKPKVKIKKPINATEFKQINLPSKNYIEELSKMGYMIKNMEEDGNCLFRATSDQIYGTQLYHADIRKLCLDYLVIEQNYFKNFIVGGLDSQKFKSYIEAKRMDGSWGDDVEIQALSEIYNRSIEIYMHSSKPMRTFHENAFIRGDPMRLSYHGKSHYNSIKKKELENFGLTDEKFGIIEEKALNMAKSRNRKEFRKKTNNWEIEIEQSIYLSRNDFEQKGVADMELALSESLRQLESQQKEMDEKALKYSMDTYDQESTDQFLLDQVKQLSLIPSQEQHHKHPTENSEKILKESEILFSNLENNTIMKVVQEGFPYELVLKAYEIVGDDPELIISFITENLL